MHLRSIRNTKVSCLRVSKFCLFTKKEIASDEMDSSNPNWNTYQTTGDGSSAEFTRLSHLISSHVQKISQNAATIQRMVGQIGTPQDSEQLRQKLHETQHFTLTLSHGTTDSLKQLTNLPQPSSQDEQRQWKLQRERLTNDFTTVLNNFQTIQRSAAQKEKASVQRVKVDTAVLIDEQEKQQEETAGSGLTQQQRLQIEQNVDIATLKEREQSIRQLENDIVDVNQIFKDLALMVHEQGEMIDSIEANVDSAQIHVEQGSSQILQAARYQSKARRKKVIIFIVLLVAVGVLALIISLSVR